MHCGLARLDMLAYYRVKGWGVFWYSSLWERMDVKRVKGSPGHQKTLAVIALIAAVPGPVAAGLLSADFSVSGTLGKCIICYGLSGFSLIVSPCCSVKLIRECGFPAAVDSIADPETGRQSRYLIPFWRRKVWVKWPLSGLLAQTGLLKSIWLRGRLELHVSGD
jgi:hypothetical protein